MRVCFLVTDQRWSGRARAFAEAASALARRRVECVVVAGEGPVAAAFRAAGIDVVPMLTGGLLRAAWRLSALLRSRDIDALYVHGERDWLLGALAVRLAGRGHIVVRVPALSRLLRTRGTRLAARLASTRALFAFGQDLEASATTVTGDAVLATPGVARPPLWHATLPIERGHHRVVILAGESPVARVLPLLRAVAQVAREHVPIAAEIIGTALDADAIRIHAAALHVGDRITIGAVSRTAQAAADALARADLAWVVADSDDALFEMLGAIAADVPVACDRTALTLRVLPLDAAEAFPAGTDTADIAVHLFGLLTDDERRKRLLTAEQTALDTFAIEGMLDGYLEAASSAAAA
jgi:hypothetical protein